MIAIGRIVKDSLLVAFGQAGAMAALFVQGVLVARHLGPELYGQWVLVVATFNFLMAFLSFRTSDALTAFWVDPRYDTASRRRQLFSSALYAELVTKLAAAGAGVAAILFCVPSLRRDLGIVGHLPVYVCAATKLIGFLTPVWMSLVRASRHTRLFAAVPAAQAWLSLALIVVLFQFWGATVLSVAVALFVVEAVGAVVRWRTLPLWSQPAQATRSTLVPPLSVYRERRALHHFWSMMCAGYIASCLSSVIKEADTIVVGWLGSPAVAGLYRVAKSLVSTFQTGIATLSTVIIQDFADCMRGNRLDEIRMLLRRVLPGTVLLVALASAVAVVFVDPFLKIVLGNGFEGARTPFLYLLPGVALATAFFWVQPLAVTLQSSQTLLRVSVLNFLAYVVTLGSAAWMIGPWAAALALSVAWGFGHLALLAAIWPKLNADVPLRSGV